MSIDDALRDLAGVAGDPRMPTPPTALAHERLKSLKLRILADCRMDMAPNERWRLEIIETHLSDIEHHLESEARAHREEVERLTRVNESLANTYQEQERVLSDRRREVESLRHELNQAYRDKAACERSLTAITIERDGLRCTVDCLTANQAGLRSDLKAASNDTATYKSREKLAQQFEEACRQRDRILQVVRDELDVWGAVEGHDGVIRIARPVLEKFKARVEAAAQPLAATVDNARTKVRSDAADALLNAITSDWPSWSACDSAVDALIAAVKESQ